MSEQKKGGLVVSLRPQISVEMTEHGDIVIATSAISDDFSTVEHEEVVFPADCGKEVAKAILNLLKK